MWHDGSRVGDGKACGRVRCFIPGWGEQKINSWCGEDRYIQFIYLSLCETARNKRLPVSLAGLHVFKSYAFKH